MSTTVANQHTECASELALAMPIASNFQERPSRGIEYEVALAERLQSGVEVLLRVTAGTGNQIGDMFDAINDCRSHLREDLRALHQNADASGDYDHLEQQQRDAGTVALLHLQQQATSTVQEILNRTELALRGTDIDLGSSRLTVVLERYHLAVASHLETIQAPLAPLLVLGSKAPEIVDPPRASSSFDAAHEVLCELSKTLVKAQKQIINDAVQQGGTTPSDVPEDGAAIATLDVGYVRTSVGMPDDLRLARDNLRVAIGYLQYTESLVEKELNAYGTIKNSLGIVHNAIPILGHLSVVTGNTAVLCAIIENPWNGSAYARTLAIEALGHFGSETDANPISRSVHDPLPSAEQRPHKIVDERFTVLDRLTKVASGGNDLDKIIPAIQRFGFDGISSLQSLSTEGNLADKTTRSDLLSSWCGWTTDLAGKPSRVDSSFKEAYNEARFRVARGLTQFAFNESFDPAERERAGKALLKLWATLPSKDQ